jgi:glycerate kinase
MSYKEMLIAAKKAKKVERLETEFIQFKKSGIEVIGRLLNKVPVNSQTGTGHYYQYLMDTDNGKVKFALGSAADNDAGALMVIGGIYSIVFKGKEQLSGGRKMNTFEILQIEAPPESAVGGDSDIPF